ncbi:SAM-dependent methyltransferase [Streptomyces sp. NPDC008141]|uniref:SAM-dependent methyltransferase n=1 Tax=Streptomyces sp. NPDC008141 TaxID=3364815 RepID=UPI0036E6ABC4
MAHVATTDSHIIDVRTPSVARMYDWLLGGIENYESDRDACAALLEVAPSSREMALTNRAFLRRVVRYLAQECGVRQFLDHGSGLPTQDNVHQIAQSIAPASRVVYIDNDPIVLAHGRTALEENNQTAVIEADMRDTAGIFAHPDVKRLIKPDEPTAALFVSVLHCLPDADDPGALVRKVARLLAPGSFLVVCQLVSDRPAVREGVTAMMERATHGKWGRVREKEEVAAYLDGMDVMPPGLVDVTRWRPDNEVVPRRPEEWEEWGGVVRL